MRGWRWCGGRYFVVLFPSCFRRYSCVCVLYTYRYWWCCLQRAITLFCGLNVFSRLCTPNIRTLDRIDLYSTTYNLQEKKFHSDLIITEKYFSQQTVLRCLLQQMISLTLQTVILFLFKTFTHFLNTLIMVWKDTNTLWLG